MDFSYVLGHRRRRAREKMRVNGRIIDSEVCSEEGAFGSRVFSEELSGELSGEPVPSFFNQTR